MKSIILLLLSTTAFNLWSAPIDYQVRFDLNAQELYVKACFDEAPPKRLKTSTRKAKGLIDSIRWYYAEDKSSTIPAVDNYSIRLYYREAGCLQYTVDFGGRESRINSKRLRQQHPQDVILRIAEWLWLPDDLSAYPTTVTFSHAQDYSISSPWTLISRSATETRYRIPDLPLDWTGYVAIGQFDVETIRIGESELRVAMIEGLHEANKPMLREWIRSMADSIAAIGGEFPVKQAQVIVYLISGYNGSVPWGQVNRGGGSGVMFFVNARQDRKRLFADWTAAHEFSHLLLPYTPYDRWLSEGFASYHQNITRARVGLLDEQTAWEKLLSGFERGRKTANRPGAPYVENAGRSHNMQMYWGGAVMALLIEVELYKQTEGKLSMSSVLAQLDDCCLESSREWRARQVIDKLDEISGTTAFSKTYRKHIYRNSYPDYKQALSELGIQHNGYSIRLSDSAPLADLRDRIMKGTP
ncbi:hypothetical protein [Marinicella sp. W31]|uniref:hypothetical protein n=1 Tax=Marinicella sp. W31 TaxID=3023713 RepID=UPI0037577E57